MTNSVSFKIESVSPLLMHNGMLADPEYSYTKKIKEFTSKRKKTEADLAEMAKYEFLGSLYQENGRVVVPADVLIGTLISAAKKSKQGSSAKSGLWVDENPLLQYDGPTAPLDLWEHKDKDDNKPFVNRSLVKVQTSKVVRTRPMFSEWGLDFTVNFNPTILQRSEIIDFVKTAGEQVGIGDYRPRYGRFKVIEVS